MAAFSERIEKLGALVAEYSERARSAFEGAAEEVLPRLGEEAAKRWVELGCVIAQSSGAAAIRYFRESPEIFRAMPEPALAEKILKIALPLASRDHGIALEFFRQSPLVAPAADAEKLRAWAEVSLEIAAQNYTAGIEVLKAGIGILPQLGPARLSLWAQTGLRLAQEDLKTKDFLALEYFRVSPELLGRLPLEDLRGPLLEIVHRLAETSSRLAVEFLKQATAVLSVVGSLALQETVIRKTRSLAETAPAVIPEWIGHILEALALAEGSVNRFEHWAQQGLQLARSNPERAGAYFALRLKISRDALQQLSHAVFLRDISRTLKLYAEGLCGCAVEVRGAANRSAPTTPDGVITLPEKIALHKDPAENFRFYKVMAFHEAGHLEFKSFDPVSREALQNLREALERSSRAQAEERLAQALKACLEYCEPAPVRGESLLSHFTDAALAQSLWMIVEESRIDYRLRHEYRGIRADLNRVIGQQLKGRPDLNELPAKRAVLEALLQLSVADTAEVPLRYAETVSEAYEILRSVQHPRATVDDTLKAVLALYQTIRNFLDKIQDETVSEQKELDAPAAPEDLPQTAPLPIENFSFRSPLDVESAADKGPLRPGAPPPPAPPSQDAPAPQDAEDRPPSATVPQAPAQPPPPRPSSDQVYYYDEWDWTAGDYRARWCRLEEKPLEETSADEVDRILQEYGALVGLIRRYFEQLRPEAFKKIKKQEHGEEIDLESAVEAFAERKAGLSPSGKVYSHRLKKNRDVSVAFLVDVSGSTSQQLDTGPGRPKRIIDIQKEGLLLLGEALDALGDEFSIYGFSGHSRHQVDLFCIKDFQQPYGPLARQRIGALRPQGQNRDGAAIRHMVAKLSERPARVRLLVLLSDGRPLDEEYAGAYALEDTRAALREAGARGIHPFCITVDRQATDYVQDLYSEVSYTIVQDIAALPRKLPRIYKQLTT